MASAAEQLAANLNFSSFAKATELRQRIWFTLGALIVFRIGTYIPMPGIDPAAFKSAFDGQAQGILGIFNMLAGGAVGRMAIFALGIMPYISASIIVQLLATVSPRLEALKKEGEAGRKALNQYTRMGTVVLAAIQAFGIGAGLQNSGVVLNPGPFFLASTVITLTGGVMFLMWLGEQITSRGVGNGISLIIFSGIVAAYPGAFYQVFESGRNGSVSPFGIVLFFIILIATIGVIVYVERAQRRLLVQYPKRQVSQNRQTGGESSHLPLKINTAGVIPPIFASSLLLLPLTFLQFQKEAPEWLQTVAIYLNHGQPLYMALYGLLIVFFCFFYTAIVFNPADTADNLKKYGGFIPGIRPGKRTADYIDYVLTRLTAVGAIYMVGVCLVPEFILNAYGQGFAWHFGGTSLLILVSTTMDTVAQVQSHLLAHQYEGLIKKSRLKGARR
ncbi:MAG: preprotein translocase subunit SecY [Micropepsaceae bacterium]